jgi:hypothetical protein
MFKKIVCGSTGNTVRGGCVRAWESVLAGIFFKYFKYDFKDHNGTVNLLPKIGSHSKFLTFLDNCEIGS